MTDDISPDQPAPPWTNPRVIGAGIAVILFIIFVLQNARSARVSFLFWDFDMPLIILMVLCLAAGIGIWELARYLKRRHSAT